jgi:chromate reductase, NAD(P)H dehydrogenase (quinone)
MARARKVAVFVGSLRAASYNRQLALGLAKLAPSDWAFEHVEIGDLPLYNQDHDKAMPEPALRLKQHVAGAEALLFVTAEYNRSIPGVLKNAIDTASRPYGHNSFAGKPAGVIGASVGAIGTALAQQHLRNVLAYLDVPVLGQPEAFIHYPDGLVDAGGNITDARVRSFLQQWVDAYVAFVDAHLRQVQA